MFPRSLRPDPLYLPIRVCPSNPLDFSSAFCLTSEYLVTFDLRLLLDLSLPSDFVLLCSIVTELGLLPGLACSAC